VDDKHLLEAILKTLENPTALTQRARRTPRKTSIKSPDKKDTKDTKEIIFKKALEFDRRVSYF
jgi:hypothetical protein